MHVLPAAHTTDRAIGLAETQAAPVPRRRSRAPFLLRNALPAPPARSNAHSRRAPTREGELPPVPTVLTIAAEAGPPMPHNRAHPSAPTFQEFPSEAKARVPVARPNASLLPRKESK